MTNFKFLHRATGLPGGNAATDRVVICNGRTIGRVYQVEAGQQEGVSLQLAASADGAGAHAT